MYAYWDIKRDGQFFILGHFLHFYHIVDPKIKIKKTWRYYAFTHVHHKWRSYDVWLVLEIYEGTEFFVILGYFSVLWPS